VFNLAICNENGKGVEKNQREAIRFHKLGKIRNDKDTIFNLGTCYEKGEGVEKNYQKQLIFILLLVLFMISKLLLSFLVFS
jgi:TPR repeat protein